MISTGDYQMYCAHKCNQSDLFVHFGSDQTLKVLVKLQNSMSPCGVWLIVSIWRCSELVERKEKSFSLEKFGIKTDNQGGARDSLDKIYSLKIIGHNTCKDRVLLLNLYLPCVWRIIDITLTSGQVPPQFQLGQCELQLCVFLVWKWRLDNLTFYLTLRWRPIDARTRFNAQFELNWFVRSHFHFKYFSHLLVVTGVSWPSYVLRSRSNRPGTGANICKMNKSLGLSQITLESHHNHPPISG